MPYDVPDLKKYDKVALDLETTGLHWWSDSIFGVALSTRDRSYYWDVRKDGWVLDWLRANIKFANLVVNHNIKFDILFLRKAGIVLEDDKIDCTMVRAAYLDEHLLQYDLDSLGKKYLGKGKVSDIYVKLADMFGGKPTRNAQAPNMSRAPAELIGPYAKTDTELALALHDWQDEEIARQELQPVALIEKELLPVLIDMEWHGVSVDVEAAERALPILGNKLETMQSELDQMAGFKVNPNPSSSIKQLFSPKLNEAGRWILIDGTEAETTEGGQASINAEVLRRMQHPAASLILQMRKTLKMRDTFIAGHILSHHQNGVIHANYNQTRSENDLGTTTGRLSVNSPALQQIPKRDKEIASIVRALFVADHGHKWLCFDWSQMDYRMMAHYVDNKTINDAYAKNPDFDFHQLVADLTGLPRSARFAGDANAKQINLGLVFGMGMGKLAREMGLPFTVGEARGKQFYSPGPEAAEVFAKYHKAIPGVRDMLDSASRVAKSRGYVRTIGGRRIRFPRGQFAHKAGGLIFQGSAADALKVKLVHVHRLLKQIGNARLVLNVHDEFDISCPQDEIAGTKNAVLSCLQEFNEPFKFRVPIRASVGQGENWWEASKD